MKELFKDSRVWIIAGIALLIGAILSIVLTKNHEVTSCDAILKQQDTEIQDSLKTFLKNHPAATAQEISDLLDVAIAQHTLEKKMF